MYSQVQQCQQDADGFLFIPGKYQRQRQFVYVALKGFRQCEAVWMALKASLHCPMSSRRGRPLSRRPRGQARSARRSNRPEGLRYARICRRRRRFFTATTGGLFTLEAKHVIHLLSLLHFKIVPSVAIVVICSGIALPLRASAARAAASMPPQQGTSMRATAMDWIRLADRIAASFSA